MDKEKNSHKAERSGKKHIALILIGLMMAMLLAALDQTIFSTALPTIVGELNGVNHMLWVTTAYILASTIMLPVYGKLGDLIGRKGLFMGAISVFIAGSIVGGLAHSMTWLIIGRAIQGIGGGGLMILAQAIIADVVPARERGKYMGIMGGVFALSSVAGPLLGGWFTESIGWRWAFWMNIPLGLAALASALVFIRLPKVARNKPSLDVLGIGLLALTSSAIVLTTTWGGTTYDWLSPQIIGLVITAIVSTVAFIFAEHKAKEPIMPLELFKDRNFKLATSAGLIIGVAMFGVLAYMPTYLQMVAGVSATKAGLLMIPMMASLLAASIICGQLVTKTGKYKWFPVVGTAIMVIALVLLSSIKSTMEVWHICSYLAMLGVGLGMGMQILVLIVQNSFPISKVGTATALNNYFRQMGASVGAAVIGSLFAHRLTALLVERMPAAVLKSSHTNSFTPAIVNNLPEPIHGIVIGSYNDALAPTFLYIVPLAVVAVGLLIFIKEKPLSTTVEEEIAPESMEIDGANHVI